MRDEECLRQHFVIRSLSAHETAKSVQFGINLDSFGEKERHQIRQIDYQNGTRQKGIRSSLTHAYLI
jgi:hypothetical protein